jgi:capsular polysaccharide biosynthesis protein
MLSHLPVLVHRWLQRHRQRAVFGLVRNSAILFDEDFYRAANPGLDFAYTPFDHYLYHGVHENRRAHRLFDPVYYRSQHGELAGVKNLFHHYSTIGWRQGWQPHPFFDPAWYLAQNLEVAASGIEPLRHYLSTGWRERRSPHPFFSVPFYLTRYTDIAEAGVEPLQHYLTSGAAEKRRPNALFDPELYVKAHAAEGVTLETAALHCLTHCHYDAAELAQIRHIRLQPGIGRVDDWLMANGLAVRHFPTEPATSWPAPEIINRRGPSATITAILPPSYLGVLPDAIAIPGTRAIVTADGRMLHDQLADPLAVDLHPPIQGIGRFENNECVTGVFVAARQRLTEAIIISGDTDTNYFHWLLEALPKLALIEQAAVPLAVPVLIPTGLPENLMVALRRVLGERSYIARPPYIGVEVERLWYPSDQSRILDNLQHPVRPDYDGIVSPAAVRYMRAKLGAPTVTATRRIYVKRASTYRFLVNEGELIAALERAGFETIDAGALTLDQQIEIFAAVKLVVMPGGAAQTNLIFCQPGSRALGLAADHPQSNLHIFTQVAHAAGVTLSFCLGERAYTRQDAHTLHDDFSVDIPAVLEWIGR